MRIPYMILTSEIVTLCIHYEVNVPSVEMTLDGKNYVSESAYMTMHNALIDKMDFTIFGDDDPENDATDEQYEIAYSQMGVFYWSTEAHTWV